MGTFVDAMLRALGTGVGRIIIIALVVALIALGVKYCS